MRSFCLEGCFSGFILCRGLRLWGFWYLRYNLFAFIPFSWERKVENLHIITKVCNARDQTALSWFCVLQCVKWSCLGHFFFFFYRLAKPETAVEKSGTSVQALLVRYRLKKRRQSEVKLTVICGFSFKTALSCVQEHKRGHSWSRGGIQSTGYINTGKFCWKLQQFCDSSKW